MLLNTANWAVVVPNWNGAALLPGLIANMRSVLPDVPFVIVDDKSTDESLKVLNQHGVPHTVNRGARGFAATVNVGLQWVLQNVPEARYVLVANSDIAFPEEFRTSLSRLEQKIPELEAAGVIGFEERSAANSGTKSSDLHIDRVDCVPGFLFMVPMSTVQQIGYFAEGYFMYGEEMDYFARAQRHGLKVYCSNIGVMHQGEGSGGRFLNTWLAHRNAIRLAIKCLSPLRVGATVASFFLAPIRYSAAQIAQSPSLSRTLRYGALASIGLLCAAFIWNVVFLPQTLRERFSEDRHIRATTRGHQNAL